MGGTDQPLQKTTVEGITDFLQSPSIFYLDGEGFVKFSVALFTVGLDSFSLKQNTD